MTIEVRVPQLPESVADATLVAWHKQPGDSVSRDENLVDLETDKVVLEVPAPAAGVITEIRLKDGTTVTSGQVLALIEERGAGTGAGTAAVPGASAPAVPGANAPVIDGRHRRQTQPRRQARGGGEQARLQGAGRRRTRRTGIEIGRGEFPRHPGEFACGPGRASARDPRPRRQGAADGSISACR